MKMTITIAKHKYILTTSRLFEFEFEL